MRVTRHGRGKPGQPGEDRVTAQEKAESGLWWVERYVGGEELVSVKIDNFERHR